jgi:hypothetical protein
MEDNIKFRILNKYDKTDGKTSDPYKGTNKYVCEFAYLETSMIW